ncbi:putative ribulose-phosphate 3-epimerase [Helianthus anomalus]
MLASDFANLASEAERMVNFGADWLHMDIMVLQHHNTISNQLRLHFVSSIFTLAPDQLMLFCRMGVHFVPNLTTGAPVIESLRKHTKECMGWFCLKTITVTHMLVNG